MGKDAQGGEEERGGGASKVLKKALKKEKYGNAVDTPPTSREAREKRLQEKKAKKKAAKKAKKANGTPEAPQGKTIAVDSAVNERGETAEEAAKAKKAWKADMMSKKAEKKAEAPARNEALRATGKQTKKDLYKAKKAALKAAAVGQPAVPAKGGEEFTCPPLDPRQRIDKKQLDCFLTGLAYTATEEHIAAHFRTALGPCSSEVLRDPETGKSRGMAFVTFDAAEHAARAVGMTNSKIHGRWIKVRLCDVRESERRAAAAENAIAAARPDDCLSVVVSGLADKIAEDDVWELFKDCQPSNVNLLYDKVTGEFRRMAFVDFEDGDAVDLAVKKDGGVLKGKRVGVRYKAAKGEGPPAKPGGEPLQPDVKQKKVDTKGVRPDRVNPFKPVVQEMAQPTKFDSDSEE